ncbi:DUF4330 domain-containing protein [bacterium]|nr:DUF4330 domain-containing protein [bacterium]
MIKKLKLTDYIIIALIIIICAIGTFAVFKKKSFSKLPVEKEATIQFEVFFRGITLSVAQSPFVLGEDAFITIRNVPYTKLKIVDFQGLPRMAVFPDKKNEKGYIVAPDVSMPNMYDFIVRLEDKAKKTSDGYVAGGNKIKMGIPVVIEGPTYKYTGTISNVFEKPAPQETQAPADVEEETPAE